MDVELARYHWDDGRRRIERLRPDAAAYDRLMAQVAIVVDELRRRVGATFTLGELASAYDRAEEWGRDALDAARGDDWPVPDTATVADAAFHLYAKGASDYVP